MATEPRATAPLRAAWRDRHTRPGARGIRIATYGYDRTSRVGLPADIVEIDALAAGDVALVVDFDADAVDFGLRSTGALAARGVGNDDAQPPPAVGAGLDLGAPTLGPFPADAHHRAEADRRSGGGTVDPHRDRDAR